MKHTIVADRFRSEFIPNLVAQNPQATLAYENAVYAFMRKFTDYYKGGHWEFIEFENGAKAMIFDHGEIVMCHNHDNYYDGGMSIRALSMACNLMACSHLSFMTTGQTQDRLAENYHLLREVIGLSELFKREVSSISRIID